LAPLTGLQVLTAGFALNFDGAPNRPHQAKELNKNSVTSLIDDTALVTVNEAGKYWTAFGQGIDSCYLVVL
jgi:hypothetical protein